MIAAGPSLAPNRLLFSSALLLALVAPTSAGAQVAAPAVPAVPEVRAPAPSGDVAAARAELALARRALAAHDAAAAEPRFQRALQLARSGKEAAVIAVAADGLALAGAALKRPDPVIAENLVTAQQAYRLAADEWALRSIAERLKRYRPAVAARAPTAPPPPQATRPPKPSPAPEPEKESESTPWNKPSAQFSSHFGVAFVLLKPFLPGGLDKQFGGVLRSRWGYTSMISSYWSIGGLGNGKGAGLLYELGFEIHQTIDLALAYLTFGLGGGIDGLTGREDGKKYGLPLAGVFPFRARLTLGEVGFFNLFGEAKVAWALGDRQGPVTIGIEYLDRARVSEATVEFGIHFKNGLELTASRRHLYGVRFDSFSLRMGSL